MLKGLSMKQITWIFLEVESPTLSNWLTQLLKYSFHAAILALLHYFTPLNCSLKWRDGSFLIYKTWNKALIDQWLVPIVIWMHVTVMDFNKTNCLAVLRVEP